MQTDLLEPPIDMNVVKLNVTDQEIAKMKADYLPLKIKGIEDKAGLKAVYDARQIVKKTRVGVEKHAKDLKESALAWQRKVNTEKDRIVGELETIESHLQSEEDTIAAEKERLRIEAEKKEQAIVQARVDQLTQYGYEINIHFLKSLSEADFLAVVATAKSEYEKQLAGKAEEKRLADAEAARLKAEREELQRLREQQAEAQRVINENNARIKKEQEEKDAAIRAEQKKIEDDKRAMELQKEQAAEAKRREEEMKLAREQAAEAARLKAIEDSVREAKEKAEAERLAKEEENRQLALRPDKEKLQSFANTLSALQLPDVKDEKAQAIVNDVKIMINKMQAHIINKIKAL